MSERGGIYRYGVPKESVKSARALRRITRLLNRTIKHMAQTSPFLMKYSQYRSSIDHMFLYNTYAPVAYVPARSQEGL